MCQLVAGPILGRLSDRYGRRPVLVVSQAGTAISFLILGLSRDYTIMLLARMLDGASGGNILVAQAYVADVTRPQDRARGMGLIGAAFGVGFVLGPLLGGLLLSLPIDAVWLLRVPFLVAAALSTVAWVLVIVWLPESTDATRRASARVLSGRGLAATLLRPRVGLLVGVGALVVFGFASLEGTFSLYLDRRMGWSPRQAAFAFAYLGVVSAIVQGGLIRRLVPRYGEPRLIVVGLTALAAGLVGLAWVESLGGLLVAMLVVAVGQGLCGPSVSGLISRLTSSDEQGAVFGTLISAQTLARMVNYVAANALLGRFGPSAPYWQGAVVVLVALGLTGWILPRKEPLGPVPAEGTNRSYDRAGEPAARASQEG
jgi:DHA1 family tetracycline resistance protein-like MFS transporter